jgi:hypothetical protein
MSVDVARHQWDEGLRRIERTAREEPRHQHLSLLVDAVVEELRKRVGQTYSLAELASVYRGSEDWVRDVVGDSAPPKAQAGIRDAALVQDAAFARYSRGATDYRP